MVSSLGASVAKAGKALLHGLSRAAITRAQGGKFSAGFWSGFTGSALGGLSAQADTLGGQLAIQAIVGGTASELGGGKFANGAVSAAFVMMFNDWLHDASNLAAGFGDTVSFGLTSEFRQTYGYDSVIDYDSGLYFGGEVAGYGVSVASVWTAGLYGGANSVFWSGYKQGAQTYAMALGITIEKTLIGNLANGRISNSYFWKAASWTFSRNAIGPVQAVIRAEGAVWSTIERPYLMRKGIGIIYK